MQMSCKKAGIDGLQRKKEEEDKGKKGKDLWKKRDINRTKNNKEGVPESHIHLRKYSLEKVEILFYINPFSYGITDKTIEEL